MEHVVFYQSAQGTPAFRRVASLEDAVSFAEHLRNVEGVTDFSVYSLAPVTLSLRAYYHVEVSGGGATTTPAAPPTPAAPDALPPAPFMSTPAPAAADSNPAPGMSFNALEEASTPQEQLPPPATSVPFAAAPLPPPSDPAPADAFVKDEPAPVPPPTDAHQEGEADSTPVDPNVVDPTVEEVVPVPTGRRSMGFFARS
jgi:hypothetical protein